MARREEGWADSPERNEKYNEKNDNYYASLSLENAVEVGEKRHDLDKELVKTSVRGLPRWAVESIKALRGRHKNLATRTKVMLFLTKVGSIKLHQETKRYRIKKLRNVAYQLGLLEEGLDLSKLAETSYELKASQRRRKPVLVHVYYSYAGKIDEIADKLNIDWSAALKMSIIMGLASSEKWVAECREYAWDELSSFIDYLARVYKHLTYCIRLYGRINVFGLYAKSSLFYKNTGKIRNKHFSEWVKIKDICNELEKIDRNAYDKLYSEVGGALEELRAMYEDEYIPPIEDWPIASSNV